MKLKKLAAGLLAAVVAVTSAIVVPVSAAVPEGTETVLGTLTNTEFILYGGDGSDGAGTDAYNCQWVQLSENDQSWTWADVLEADNTYFKVTYSMDETTVANHNNGQWGVGDWYTGDIKVSKDPAVPFYAEGWTLVADTDYSAYVPVSDLGLAASNVDEWGQIGFNLQANMDGTFTVSSVTLVEFAADDVYPTTIEISGDTVVTVGEEITLTAEVTNENGDEITTDKTVTWTADSSGNVTVDEDGVVTGVAAGTATVTASVAGEDGNITDTYEITIKAAPLESGSYGDGTYQELSDDDIANITFNEQELYSDYNSNVGDTSAQFTNAGNSSIYRFYMLVAEEDLAGKTSASIVIKHTNGKAFQLTSSKAYRKLSADQTAPEGYVYLAFVIDDAPAATDTTSGHYRCDLSWSDITLS